MRQQIAAAIQLVVQQTRLSDGSRRVTFEDLEVTPGTSYEYRLGLEDRGTEGFAGETSVTVPARISPPAVVSFSTRISRIASAVGMCSSRVGSRRFPSRR